MAVTRQSRNLLLDERERMIHYGSLQLLRSELRRSVRCWVFPTGLSDPADDAAACPASSDAADATGSDYARPAGSADSERRIHNRQERSRGAELSCSSRNERDVQA